VREGGHRCYRSPNVTLLPGEKRAATAAVQGSLPGPCRGGRAHTRGYVPEIQDLALATLRSGRDPFPMARPGLDLIALQGKLPRGDPEPARSATGPLEPRDNSARHRPRNLVRSGPRRCELPPAVRGPYPDFFWASPSPCLALGKVILYFCA
jgi:hypothetical protein